MSISQYLKNNHQLSVIYIDYLLKNSSDINENIDEDVKNTPLWIAVKKEKIHIVKYLVCKGVNYKLKNEIVKK